MTDGILAVCSVAKLVVDRWERGFRPLRFHPRDIQYLIVEYDKAEANVLNLHSFLMKLFTKNFNKKEAVLASTSIMTSDCIAEDI